MAGWESQPPDQRDRCDCCGGFLGPEHEEAKAGREEVQKALVEALKALITVRDGMLWHQLPWTTQAQVRAALRAAEEK